MVNPLERLIDFPPPSEDTLIVAYPLRWMPFWRKCAACCSADFAPAATPPVDRSK
jgi:hypothetical protein